MAGAIILHETAGWSVATWAYKYAVELALKHAQGLAPELKERFEKGLPPYMLGVTLTDLNGDQLDAVLRCLLKGYESEKQTRGADGHSPMFWEPFMHGLQELINMINSDPRVSQPRPPLREAWKESAEP